MQPALAFGPDDVHARSLGMYAGIYTAPNRIALQDWQIAFRAPDRGAIIYSTRDNSELRSHCISSLVMPIPLPTTPPPSGAPRRPISTISADRSGL
jgi:hypothetical protein